jgi:probable phosphoglycerate mutase
MHLYLIRHGQSVINLDGWEGTNLDEGLTDLGRRQAFALASWLPQNLGAVDALYCSSMRRARETVEALCGVLAVPVRYDDRLREIGNNRIDHTAWPPEQLPARYADYWSSSRPFSSIVPSVEGGESYMHFRTRVGWFVEEAVEEHQDQVVVAVCHGGVVEAIFDHVFNIGPWRRCEVWNHNTGISHFQYVAHPTRETWRLHYHNRIDHLLDEGAR